MRTILCPPMSDAGPNEYSPSPSGPHYLNVMDEPHDGDATILSTFLGNGEAWTIDVSGIPDDATIVSARIRSVQKQTTAGVQTYHVGLRMGSDEFFGPDHALSSGSSFVTANDEIPIDPTTGLPWTRSGLGGAVLRHVQLAQAGGLPRPRVTECVVLVDVTDPVDRLRVAASSRAPLVSPSSTGPQARTAGLGFLVRGGSLAPAVGLRSLAPSGAGASLAAGATVRSLAPRPITVADLPHIQVFARSLSPGVAGSTLTPAVRASVVSSEGEGS